MWHGQPAKAQVLSLLRLGFHHLKRTTKSYTKGAAYLPLGPAPNHLRGTMCVLDEWSRAVIITRNFTWRHVVPSPVHGPPCEKWECKGATGGCGTSQASIQGGRRTPMLLWSRLSQGKRGNESWNRVSPYSAESRGEHWMLAYMQVFRHSGHIEKSLCWN